MEAEVEPTILSDSELIELIDQKIDGFIGSDRPEALYDAIRYATFGGGKRVRPLLCLRACEAVGGDIHQALPAACAIELIHTFSLVHDDLPAMDDDDLRRGRPTLHKHTNEAMAILAGDAMTSLAFGILASHVQDPALAKELSQRLSAATSAMIVGQVFDTMGGQGDDLPPVDQMKSTHIHKTGMLLIASCTMGGLSGGANDQQCNALQDYASAIGLMFQAVDDLLDVTQSTEKMGKATGKDASQGKLTYPGLLGVDGTRAEIEKLLQQALDALSGFDSKADPLREMAKKLATREK